MKEREVEEEREAAEVEAEMEEVRRGRRQSNRRAHDVCTYHRRGGDEGKKARKASNAESKSNELISNPSNSNAESN